MSRSLPDLTSRIVIDNSSLKTAEAEARVSGGGIASGIKPAEQQAAKTESALAGMAARLEGFGPAGSEAAGALSSMEKTAAGLGTTLSGGLALGVGAAALAIAMLAKQGVEDYMNLANQVRTYSRVTGESAQESSRMVSMFADLGVSSDTASSAMFKLAKAAENTPQKLVAVGVEIDRNAAGGINLQNTFFNVVDAYQRAGTAADKDAILFAAFGKAGAALIPVLAENRAALQQLSDETATVFTQENLNQAHAMEVQMSRLGQEAHGMSVNIGELVVGPLTGLIQGFNDSQLHASVFTKAVQDGNNVLQANAMADRAVTASHVDLSSAQAKLAADIAETTKQLAAEQKATDALNRALDSLLGDSISVAKAQLNVAAAAETTAAAQTAWNLAVATYGPNSKQAADAADVFTKAQLDQESAIDQAAKAAMTQAQNEALASGSALTSTQAHQVYINKLSELASHLNGPVADALNAMIARENLAGQDRVATLTVNVNTNDQYGVLTSAGFTGFTARASGGAIVPGRVYRVGEQGPETFVSAQAGQILPNGVEPPGAGAGGSGGDTFHVYAAGMSAQELAVELAWQRRFAR